MNRPTEPEHGGFSRQVMAELKDFQLDAVEHVFRRLYTDEDTARRFLIASETGLGKTLVARGVIARTIDHLQGKVDRIDVLYICSNADIARQNINRLNVTGKSDFALAGRITLLPTVVHELEKNDLNFISFTPGTTFDLKSSLGVIEERALLYYLLREPWNLGNRKAPLNVLQGNATPKSFRGRVEGFGRDRNIDKNLRESFQRELKRRVEAERAEGKKDIRARFEDLCQEFKRHDTKQPWPVRGERIRVVGDLRGILASSCLEALEPDLIILDEFQRFKHLLDGTDEASRLARGLFEWGDVRTLLLSATPYKMYTMSHEVEEDDHYADFLRTLEFLEYGSELGETPQATLGEYRRSLFKIEHEGLNPAKRAKKNLENRLRRTMLRTEKLSATEDRDGMLVEVPPRSATLNVEDLESYLSLRRVLEASVGGDAMEYWKSSPYLLNFMEGYKFKEKIRHALETGNAELYEAMRTSQNLLLSWEDVENYARLDPANARLRAVLADTVDAGEWRLLWMPPSQPYYAMEGAFREAAESGITKRLVFSSWRVVPKVVAGIVSYEAERNMIRSFSRRAKNTPDARRRRPGLLRFGVSRMSAEHVEHAEHGDSGSHGATRVGGHGNVEPGNEDARLTGMPVLGLLYPAATLARACDPLSIAREIVAEGPSGSQSGLPSEQEVRERAEDDIRDLLSQIPGIGDREEGTVVDEAWYWAAPMLLDRTLDGDNTEEWFAQENLASLWSDFVEEDAESSNWARHVAQARQLYETEFYRMEALGRPPEDLASVLASLALGGPAICALRALMRVAPEAEERVLRNRAARVAWHLRSLFNLPEATNLIRSMGEDGEPYWRSVLGYSVTGCLQSVLDEYAHTLKEFQGDSNATARGVAASMSASLSLQAVNISVDHYDLENGAAPDSGIEPSRGTMRNRFALRFGDGRSDEGSVATRATQVRQAFNSPFWPFVVATTSVGQEGLDFHTYCHAVVHWNLPSNPVDLEQREGRVHRYKNHAVRKNVAQAYGLQAMNDSYADPWDALFDLATNERAHDASDMVPYWIYPGDGGARIERHVPALPLTRDRKLLDNLRRSLAAYRMVFGQARQEDLLSYLLEYFTPEEVAKYSEVLRMDLEPPRIISEDQL